MKEALRYQQGFGNHFSTEALPGALPQGQNSPQRPPYGLYPEQLSGSAFTAPRAENKRTWLYRIRPSVLMKTDFTEKPWRAVKSDPAQEPPTPPTPMRWDALEYPKSPKDFIESWVTVALNGSPRSLSGVSIHLYAANASMTNRFFYNSDGELLIVPQEGRLLIKTEMGPLEVGPRWIAVIPKGVKFQVELLDGKARGYLCENFGIPFKLPDLGPIGANGLANPRDFEIPLAAYEEKVGSFELLTKFQGKLWSTSLDASPLDVVAWHGNYVPYRYSLELFNTMNTVSFDHPDPSIFTVITSPSAHPGTANLDFVIFPPRWMVAEHTFRPPYFHRNPMSEYMGLIEGVYDAKAEGFVPGGGSLHNCMSAHGPDAATFENATQSDLKPERYAATLAFMFESCVPFTVTEFGLRGGLEQRDYIRCWQTLKSHFRKTP